MSRRFKQGERDVQDVGLSVPNHFNGFYLAYFSVCPSVWVKFCKRNFPHFSTSQEPCTRAYFLLEY